MGGECFIVFWLCCCDLVCMCESHFLSLQCYLTGLNWCCLVLFQDGSYLAEFLLAKGYEVK